MSNGCHPRANFWRVCILIQAFFSLPKALHQHRKRWETWSVRRGLLLLWIIFAWLTVVAVGVASSGEIRREFRVRSDVENSTTRIKRSGILIVPCSTRFAARGKLSADYLAQNGRCWYDLRKFREQHPEYKDLNSNQLFDRFCEHVGISMKLVFNPWATLMKVAGMAMGIPIAVLIVGWSLLWAYSGFRPVLSFPS